MLNSKKKTLLLLLLLIILNVTNIDKPWGLVWHCLFTDLACCIYNTVGVILFKY